MEGSDKKTIERSVHIRQKLFEGEISSWKRYADLVVGTTSIAALVKYELITSLLGPLPGALGLWLRRIFFPKLFREVGQGTVFGRNLVIRNAQNIRLGDRVIIDDNVLID